MLQHGTLVIDNVNNINNKEELLNQLKNVYINDIFEQDGKTVMRVSIYIDD